MLSSLVAGENCGPAPRLPGVGVGEERHGAGVSMNGMLKRSFGSSSGTFCDPLAPGDNCRSGVLSGVQGIPEGCPFGEEGRGSGGGEVGGVRGAGGGSRVPPSLPPPGCGTGAVLPDVGPVPPGVPPGFCGGRAACLRGMYQKTSPSSFVTIRGSRFGGGCSGDRAGSGGGSTPQEGAFKPRMRSATTPSSASAPSLRPRCWNSRRDMAVKVLMYVDSANER